MERFADVLLPLPVPGVFTYRIPDELCEAVKPWKRVIVQFGRQKIYTALVVNIHDRLPSGTPVKPILSVPDEHPLTNPVQYRFWQWMADYYLCHPGEVMNAALPSALKMTSETQLVLHPEFDGNTDSFSRKEELVVQALGHRGKISLDDLTSITGVLKVIPIVRSLLERKVILLSEELKQPLKPLKVAYIRLSESCRTEERLRQVFNDLEKRAFRQLEVLMSYISMSGPGRGYPEVRKTELTSDRPGSAAALQALVSKGILEQVTRTESRLVHSAESARPEDIILNEEQISALDSIRSQFGEKEVVLLHGVTSSGKTELYIRLIAEAIREGRQVLYLLPEIALTTQIIMRLRKYFGSRVGVYHSRYNEQERAEIWERVLHSSPEGHTGDDYQVILGARSALFLPFSRLGLVIVDEEHDSSYKQTDTAPRYHARDSAVFLASLHGARVLLGSATPSIESYFNCRTGKYGLASMTGRYGGIQMPEILVADIRDELRKKTMHSHFSSLLMEHIGEALRAGEQVILFQNRRGFALRLECDTCHWMPECERCDVTLIYHKSERHLRCHYCGFTRSVPTRCESCGSVHLKMKGFGTEKVEEELAILFPEARIRRMDLDTTRSRQSYQQIIKDFEQRRIDILVGTQMITKGLDFDHVSVVGILNADNMISFPDFRSFERSFQLMAQVSGRAGRKNKRGRVIIQTYRPHHSVIRYVMENDYLSMYQSQVLERRQYRYPPFYRLVQLEVRHRNNETVSRAAMHLAGMLREHRGLIVLGPEYPLVSRIRSQYIMKILIKLERGPQLTALKKTVMDTVDRFHAAASFKGVSLIPDVDPI
ncbi:MAG: primosomal protein N' [Bacteroidales bacterium]|nr:primosomal protein N' [Bacteroidales bacterium]